MRGVVIVLATLALAASACGGSNESPVQNDVPSRCPPDWPGPWTACPEADWVRRVAERAGYRVVGETGSALVAQGKGQSFYVWATEMAASSIAEPARAEGWRRLGVVERVDVYGDDELWRWWEAQRFVFRLQAGPRGGARVPSLAEMAPLVRASEEVRRPTW
jgi:hypothetical protein